MAVRTRPQDPVAIYVKVMAGSSLEAEYLGSGISHLVEHMLFKGTKTRGPGEIEKEVKSYGGFTNGSVGPDITDFHVTVGPEYFPQGMALLKDMLLNARFDQGEFVKEKEVVLKEINLNDDEPQARVFKLLNQTAYMDHTYKYPVIGYADRFRALTRDDAVKYYKRMYVPNRIVVAVAGGIDEAAAIKGASDEFGDFRPPNYEVTGLSPVEPGQIATRVAEEEMAINLAYLAMAFHSTSISDEDLFAMDVLAMILGRGDNSRLNRILVKDKTLAYNVSCWNHTPRDPGLFAINAVLDVKNMESSQQLIIDEVRRVRETDVDDAELEIARRMVLSDYIFSLQTTDEQANDIALDYILTGSPDFSRRYVEGIQAVSKADIKRVAGKYLRPDGFTTARLLPLGTRILSPGTAVKPSKDEIKKFKLDNGLVILVREDRKTPTVSVSAAMRGGLETENKNDNGISNLVAGMLLKGTSSREESEIRGAVEAQGGEVSVFSGFNSFGITMEFLKTALDNDLAILKDVLTDSVFPPDEIAKAKALMIAAIRNEDDDIFQRGMNNLRAELFAGSPYAFRYLGEDDSVNAVTREDIIGYYRTYCVPNNMVISISGDVDAQDLIKKLKGLFADLKERNVVLPAVALTRIDEVKKRSLEMDREESLVMAGFRSVSVKDPDRYPIEVMVSILSGQSGRMFDTLRGKESLAYTLGCIQKVALDTGFIAFYVATVKDAIPHSKEALSEEIRSIRETLAGADELAAAKRELIAAHDLSRQTNAFYSATSAMDELYGLGCDNLYRYREEIEKVTREDVKRVADKYLDSNARAEVVISSKK